MSLLMDSETPLHAEAFSTYIAYIGFLSCMCSLVSDEREHPGEAFPTLITYIRFMSSMNSLMDHEAVLH